MTGNLNTDDMLVLQSHLANLGVQELGAGMIVHICKANVMY